MSDSTLILLGNIVVYLGLYFLGSVVIVMSAHATLLAASHALSSMHKAQNAWYLRRAVQEKIERDGTRPPWEKRND